MSDFYSNIGEFDKLIFVDVYLLVYPLMIETSLNR